MPTNPPHLSTPAHWTNAEDFVADTVTLCEGMTPYSRTQLAGAALGLSLWTLTEVEEPLSTGRVFSRDSIEDYVSVGLIGWAPASRGNIRSMLFRMSESLGASTPTRSAFALPAAPPSAPYDSSDVKQINVWVAEQIGERAKDAAVLVALGLGAGLSASEIRKVQVQDIGQDIGTGGDVRWFVDVVGARARRIQVEEYWVHDLTEGITGRKPEDWAFCPKRIGGGKNLITNFVSRYDTEGERPSTQRMRATWLVGRMSDGTLVSELKRIAGVTSLDALDRYVRFVL